MDDENSEGSDPDLEVNDYDADDGSSQKSQGSAGFGRSLSDAAADAEGRRATARKSLMDRVRFKLRNGWRHDDKILNQYFQSCVANWKVYTGTKKPNMVLKLQCIYRQAMFGDNTAEPPENLKSLSGLKWQGWTALKGTPQVVAKRRFITYLAEIDPHLIDVMPDEKPPDGFPHDHRTEEVICAKCNTRAGCSRPLLDGNKTDLRKQLFDFEYLHEPAALQKWIRNALDTQRCIWGIHRQVAKIDIKPFKAWFEREENGGYEPFKNDQVMSILRDLVHYHFEIAWDMQQNKEEYGAEAFNHQVLKVNKLQSTYESMSGQRFVFEAPCRQNIAVCNDRRKGDGGRNHTHPVTLDDATHKDVATYDEVMELREQCKNLGLSITTGIVHNVQERRDIYRARIAGHFNAVQETAKSRERNEQRADVHKAEKIKVKELAQKMLLRQCWDACQALQMDQVMILVRRGCDPNTESPRGLTPFLTAILTSCGAEVVEELVKLKGDINGVNKFGMTPLILACRLRDTKMIHILMRSGASALQDGGRKGAGRTAVHACAELGAEEELRIILDYVKEGGGDSLRIVRLLDAQSDNGDTALMLAARIRNGVMCRVLTSLGANPNILNGQSRNACYIARNAGWTELADWLEKKVGAGVAKLETFSDLQYDKTVRYGAIKAKEAIEAFGQNFLKTVHKSTTQSPLGPPSTAQIAVAECGDRAIADQRALMDRHQMYILRRDPENRPFPPEKNSPNDPCEEFVRELHVTLDTMQENIRKGISGPNTESIPKPLAWTALMCATAMNDVKRVKFMVRCGSDPNYRNRYGTTAVMLAAQLQCAEVLVEMLVMGADLSVVDNQGFSALAYADSLPLPSNMNRDGIAVLLDSDTHGTMRIGTSAIIKMALKCGVGELRRIVESNAAEASREAVVNHFRFMRLLENAGLKRIDTLRQVHEQVATSDWRINKIPEELRTRGVQDDESETSSEMRDRETYEQRRAAEREDDDGAMRCPVCTLRLPCAHFFKADVLKSYLKKQEAESGIVSTGSKYLDMLQAAAANMKARKGKQKLAEQAILDEAGIGDRRTDRSVTFMKKYRDRERELDQKMLLRIEAERVEEERLRLEEEKAAAKARAVANGTYIEWREFFNSYGQKFFVHSDTGEKWEEHIGTDGQPYYHNPDTGVSRWDSPIPKKVIAPPPVVEEAVVQFVPTPSEEEKVESRLKVMGEADTSIKALALDLRELSKEVAAPVVMTARKTYTLPSAYKKKSALKNSGADYQVGPDGTATTIPIENLAKPEPESWAQKAPKELRGRRVVFKGVPGDDPKQPYPFLDLAELPVVEWSDIRKTPRRGEPDEAEVEADGGEGGEGGEGEETAADAGEENEATAEAKSGETGDSRAHLGKDDDLESIASPMPPLLGGSSSSSETPSTPSGGDSAADDDSSSLSSSSLVSLSSFSLGPTAPLDPIKAKLERMQRNPVPPETRRLYMFTADPITRFGQADGLLFSPKEAKPLPLDAKGVVTRLRRLGTPVPMHLMEQYRQELEHEEELRKEELHRARLREEGKTPDKPEPKPFYPVAGLASSSSLGGGGGGSTSSDDLGASAAAAAAAHIQVSGWLFISLEAIETSLAPQERVSLRSEAWATILEHMRGKLLHDWLPRCTLEPLVSPKTWKVEAPRCCVCCVGFVRFSQDKRPNELFKATMAPKQQTVVGSAVYDHQAGTWTSTRPDGSFEYSEYNLCFPCLVRRELYERVQATFPRSVRSKMATSPLYTWPFKQPAAGGSANASTSASASAADGDGAREDYLQRMSSGLGSSLPSRSASLGSMDSSYSLALGEAEGGGGSASGLYAMLMLPPGSPMAAMHSQLQRLGSPSSSFSVSAKSPTTSSKLRVIDSIEAMRRSRSSGIGGFGSSTLGSSLQNLRVGFAEDDASSLLSGDVDMGSFLDDLGLDEVASVGSVESGSMGDGSPKAAGGKRGGSKVGQERLWDEKPVEVYQSAAERRAAEAAATGQSTRQTLREKMQFGKQKGKLFGGDSATLSNGPTSLSLVTIPSQFSGSTAEARVPPKTDRRRPAEILLLPFLISRGHFEEVERTVRIAISRSTVDEGEGMLLLLKVFQHQADMYKLMGLFPLALAVYLDSVDLTASLLGFADSATVSASVCVSSCLRKMHQPVLAKTFIANFCHRLEEETFSNSTFAASKLLLESDRKFKKTFMRSEEIWTRLVAPTRPPEHPKGLRDYKSLIWDAAGLGALYRCMTAVDGQGVVSRAAFALHCDRVDPHGLGRFAQFVAYCFRLRLVDAPEIFRHLLQTLVQKQLAKSLIKTSDVARLYRHVTSPEHMSSVLAFLKEGYLVGVEAFDEMLFHSLRVLVPAFAIFLLRHGGAGLRDANPELTAQAMHGYAVAVQIQWRAKLARSRVQRVRTDTQDKVRRKSEDEARLLKEIEDARLSAEQSKDNLGWQQSRFKPGKFKR